MRDVDKNSLFNSFCCIHNFIAIFQCKRNPFLSLTKSINKLFRLIFEMEQNCRNGLSLILCLFVFFLAGNYRTILFCEQFIEPFDEQSKRSDFPEEVNSMNLEVNWNWTLFAKKGFK